MYSTQCAKRDLGDETLASADYIVVLRNQKNTLRLILNSSAAAAVAHGTRT